MMSIQLSGALTGPIWWPTGAKCGLPIKADLDSERARIVATEGDKPTLRDVIELIVSEKGGDFQNALLTADTEIIVKTWRQGRSRSRVWPITAFPSIADYVDADTFSWDFNGEDD